MMEQVEVPEDRLVGIQLPDEVPVGEVIEIIVMTGVPDAQVLLTARLAVDRQEKRALKSLPKTGQ